MTVINDGVTVLDHTTVVITDPALDIAEYTGDTVYVQTVDDVGEEVLST